MTTLSILIPDDLRSFVETQMALDGHTSASEFFQALIRAEQARRAGRSLDHLLQTALADGPATPMTRADWNTLEAQVWERHQADQGRP